MIDEKNKIEEEKEEEKKELPSPVRPGEELPAPPAKKVPWLLIGGGLVAALLLAVFVCLWAVGRSSVPKAAAPSSTRAETPREATAPAEGTDAATAALEKQGTSDEVAEIEKDINATDLSNLEQELKDIEGELSGL